MCVFWGMRLSPYESSCRHMPGIAHSARVGAWHPRPSSQVLKRSTVAGQFRPSVCQVIGARAMAVDHASAAAMVSEMAPRIAGTFPGLNTLGSGLDRSKAKEEAGETQQRLETGATELQKTHTSNEAVLTELSGEIESARHEREGKYTQLKHEMWQFAMNARDVEQSRRGAQGSVEEVRRAVASGRSAGYSAASSGKSQGWSGPENDGGHMPRRHFWGRLRKAGEWHVPPDSTDGSTPRLC